LDEDDISKREYGPQRECHRLTCKAFSRFLHASNARKSAAHSVPQDPNPADQRNDTVFESIRVVPRTRRGQHPGPVRKPGRGSHFHEGHHSRSRRFAGGTASLLGHRGKLGDTALYLLYSHTWQTEHPFDGQELNLVIKHPVAENLSIALKLGLGSEDSDSGADTTFTDSRVFLTYNF
jgi:hypothetical protein